MSANAALRNNGLRMTLLAPLTIGAAVAATVTTPILKLIGLGYLTVESIFLYGAGGTTVKAFVQTSLDGGTTWIDIMSHAFTTSAASKVSAVAFTTALAAGATPTDGTLADNTILSGLMGDRLRVKYVTTGTYTGSTSLAMYGLAKGL